MIWPIFVRIYPKKCENMKLLKCFRGNLSRVYYSYNLYMEPWHILYHVFLNGMYCSQYFCVLNKFQKSVTVFNSSTKLRIVMNFWCFLHSFIFFPLLLSSASFLYGQYFLFNLHVLFKLFFKKVNIKPF